MADPVPTHTTVAFANQGDFDAWHTAKCAELGIPYPGYVEGQDNPAVESQWTTAYVVPILYDGYVTVTLPTEEVAADPILKGLEVFTVKYDPATGDPLHEVVVPPVSEIERPIPPTWTDPDTGLTHDSETGEPI